MSFRNGQTPAGTVVVVAGAGGVNYVGLTVVTASDLTYTDSLGAVTALTAAPVGLTIDCAIVKVTVCSGVVLGYVPQ